MAREAFGVDGGRGDDDLQVRPPRQQLLQVAQQEIDVEAALVRLVDDDGVVATQQRVALRLGQQDAVGHQLDGRVGAGAVIEAHLVADHLAHRRVQFLGDALGHRSRGQAARLGVADHLAAAASQFQADLGQLRGLARAGLAADDHDLMGRDGARDLLPPGADGQILGIGDDGNGPLGTVRRRGAFGAFGAFCTFAALGAFGARARAGRAPPDAGASGLPGPRAACGARGRMIQTCGIYPVSRAL